MKIVHTKVLEWQLADKLTPTDYAINQHLDRLADITQHYEARWGYGVLQKCVPDDFKAKWDKHIQNLNQAIVARDLGGVMVLVDGVIKAYQKMEQIAVENNHIRCKQDGWSVATKYGEVIIVKDERHQSELAKIGAFDVLSLQQVAGLYEAWKDKMGNIK